MRNTSTIAWQNFSSKHTRIHSTDSTQYTLHTYIAHCAVHQTCIYVQQQNAIASIAMRCCNICGFYKIDFDRFAISNWNFMLRFEWQMWWEHVALITNGPLSIQNNNDDNSNKKNLKIPTISNLKVLWSDSCFPLFFFFSLFFFFFARSNSIFTNDAS